MKPIRIELPTDYPPQARFSGLWMLVGYLDLLQAEGLVAERPVGEVLHFYKTGD